MQHPNKFNSINAFTQKTTFESSLHNSWGSGFSVLRLTNVLGHLCWCVLIVEWKCIMNFNSPKLVWFLINLKNIKCPPNPEKRWDLLRTWSQKIGNLAVEDEQNSGNGDQSPRMWNRIEVHPSPKKGTTVWYLLYERGPGHRSEASSNYLKMLEGWVS